MRVSSRITDGELVRLRRELAERDEQIASLTLARDVAQADADRFDEERRYLRKSRAYFREQLAAAEARVAALEEEKANDNELVGRLAKYLDKLESLGIGCAFCEVKLGGSPLGRSEEGLANIKLHITECPNHPLRKVEAERDAARAALREFGAHYTTCKNPWESDGCTCGLSTALSGVSAVSTDIMAAFTPHTESGFTAPVANVADPARQSFPGVEPAATDAEKYRKGVANQRQ